MGFFSNLGHLIKNAFKKVGKFIRHDAKVIFKGVKTAAVAVGKTVVKVGKEIVKDASIAVDFVVEHSDTVGKIANIAAGVISAIGTATGQPEIVALGTGLAAAGNKITQIADKAKKAKNIIDKVKHVANAVAHKKDLAGAMHITADAMTEAGASHGNNNLIKLGEHFKSGAGVIDKAVSHIHGVMDHPQLKPHFDAHLPGAVKAVEETTSIFAGRRSKRRVQVVPKVKSAKSTNPKTPKPTKPLEVKTPKSAKPKTKRAPSAYNLHVKKVIAEGGTLKSAAVSWKLLKAK